VNRRLESKCRAPFTLKDLSPVKLGVCRAGLYDVLRLNLFVQLEGVTYDQFETDFRIHYKVSVVRSQSTQGPRSRK
jgi:hypothetical protein